MLPTVYRTEGSGGSRGGPPSLFLDHTEARRAKKNFETARHLISGPKWRVTMFWLLGIVTLHFSCTVNSLYSRHSRDLELVSSLAGVRNSGSLPESNFCNLFLLGIQLLSVLSRWPLQRGVSKGRVHRTTFPYQLTCTQLCLLVTETQTSFRTLVHSCLVKD